MPPTHCRLVHVGPDGQSKIVGDPKPSARWATARRKNRRRGVAAVELAVCLPMIVLMVFGSIEASSIIFLKQTLNVSAYEATREAIRDGSGNAEARNRAENILNARNINGFNIAFNGESLDADRGDEIIVTVTAPSAANSPLLGQFIANRDLTSRVVMVKQ